jgi:hypothetical protein
MTVAAHRYTDAAFTMRIAALADRRARSYRTYIQPHDYAHAQERLTAARREYDEARRLWESALTAAASAEE